MKENDDLMKLHQNALALLNEFNETHFICCGDTQKNSFSYFRICMKQFTIDPSFF